MVALEKATPTARKARGADHSKRRNLGMYYERRDDGAHGSLRGRENNSVGYFSRKKDDGACRGNVWQQQAERGDNKGE